MFEPKLQPEEMAINSHTPHSHLICSAKYLLEPDRIKFLPYTVNDYFNPVSFPSNLIKNQYPPQFTPLLD